MRRRRFLFFGGVRQFWKSNLPRARHLRNYLHGSRLHCMSNDNGTVGHWSRNRRATDSILDFTQQKPGSAPKRTARSNRPPTFTVHDKAQQPLQVMVNESWIKTKVSSVPGQGPEWKYFVEYTTSASTEFVKLSCVRGQRRLVSTHAIASISEYATEQQTTSRETLVMKNNAFTVVLSFVESKLCLPVLLRVNAITELIVLHSDQSVCRRWGNKRR